MENKTILVVDDEKPVRQVLARFLDRLGYQVLRADTVSAARHLLDYNTVDLVLCDYNMPGENGMSFLHKLKSSHPRVLRVLITGYGTLEMAVEAINQAQVHHFITKPFELDNIRTVVQELLDWSDRRQGPMPRAFTRKQHEVLASLRTNHPGIEQVDRNTQGAIVLGDEWEDFLKAEDTFPGCDEFPADEVFLKDVDRHDGVGLESFVKDPGEDLDRGDSILFDEEFQKMIGA